MQSEWTCLPLERAVDVLIDYRGKSPPKSEEGVPVISAKVVKDGRVLHPIEQTIDPQYYPIWMTRGLPKAGDVIMTTEGPMGEVAQLDSKTAKYALGQRIVCMRGRKGVLDNTFLKFLLISPRQQAILHSFATGTTVAGISQKSLRSVPLVLPPYGEQVAMGRPLGSLDDKIELNRRMNETLEAMARAIFKNWFVDFGPTRAKAEGRTPYLAPDIWSLFSDRFDDLEKPEEWEVQTIDRLAEWVAMGPFGSSIKVSTFVADGIPIISGQHLWGTLLEDSEFNFVTEAHASLLQRANVQQGDVIFTHAGSIGQVSYIPETSRYQRYVISQRQFYMRCNRSVMSPLYIVCYFKTPEGQHKLLANTSSTGVPSISRPVSNLRQIELVVPPPAVLDAFEAVVGLAFRTIASNDEQSRTLAATRDLLLPKLMSGEIRIRDAEKTVEAIS